MVASNAPPPPPRNPRCRAHDQGVEGHAGAGIQLPRQLFKTRVNDISKRASARMFSVFCLLDPPFGLGPVLLSA